MASGKRCARLASVWRRLAIRVERSYRTLSHKAAYVLGGHPPLDLLAGMEARTYDLARRRPSGLQSLGSEEADNIEKVIRWSGVQMEATPSGEGLPTAGAGGHSASRRCSPDSGVSEITSTWSGRTLEECPAWTDERQALKSVAGWVLSLFAIVPNMVDTEWNWRAVAPFCEQ
ncbi:uncharacterized protein LOC143221606, partial [Lasioglossum baleicum]|uniref:uncharacterized protein LOC143221606 n=1 Tax=Lasioglossum baleicum TaxID=434251 RepID=UPI003FCD468E